MVVLVAGATLTARAGYLHAKAEMAGVLIERAWKESVRTSEAKKPWSWADMHPVARLRIPRLKYDEYVLDNAAPRTLAFGPGVVANGAAIGAGGNVVIAGHRTSWFLPLKGVREGDQIDLQWYDRKKKTLRTKEYLVEKIEVVDPKDVRYLKTGEEDLLTLITCYPFGYGATSPQRLVVRAAVNPEGEPGTR